MNKSIVEKSWTCILGEPHVSCNHTTKSVRLRPHLDEKQLWWTIFLGSYLPKEMYSTSLWQWYINSARSPASIHPHPLIHHQTSPPRRPSTSPHLTPLACSLCTVTTEPYGTESVLKPQQHFDSFTELNKFVFRRLTAEAASGCGDGGWKAGWRGVSECTEMLWLSLLQHTLFNCRPCSGSGQGENSRIFVGGQTIKRGAEARSKFWVI